MPGGCPTEGGKKKRKGVMEGGKDRKEPRPKRRGWLVKRHEKKSQKAKSGKFKGRLGENF